MKAIEKLRETSKLLERFGIEAPEKEALIMVSRGLNTGLAEIYRDNPEFSAAQAAVIDDMLKRRRAREPLQYILGYEEFLGLKIIVRPGVLIPRPETEYMAEYAIKTVTNQKSEDPKLRRLEDENLLTSPPLNFSSSQVQSSSLLPRPSSLSILDLCTGSGCIALAIAREFPEAEVYGTDISKNAVRYARRNAELNRIKNATFLTGSLFQPFEHIETDYCLPVMPSGVERHQGFSQRITFDLIISNPPYIRTEDIKRLQPEIKDWEPVIALDGGRDGLALYRELIPSAGDFLKDGGYLMLEVGEGQSSEVADIIKSSGYVSPAIIKDYAGIERIVQAQWKR